jgi:hypothetical protein
MAVKLLIPVFVLVIWTNIVLVWMGHKRFGAMKKAGIRVSAIPGGRGQDLNKVLDAKINWPAHNYTHLMEQPTVFYATVISLAVMGQGHVVNIALAWAYVLLRIVHSVWQIKVNTIPVRATIFLLSTLCLLALAIHGLIGAVAA